MLYWQFSLCDVKVLAKRFCYRVFRSPGFEFLHQEAWTKWTLFPMQHWLPCCPLQVTHASRPCFTTPIHFPTSIPSFTSPLHAPASHPCFTSLLHVPASLPRFTSPLHFLLHFPTLLPLFTSLPFPSPLLACPSDKQLSNFCLSGADLRTWLFHIFN